MFQLVQRRSDATVLPPNEALSREVHNLFRLLKSRHSALLTPYSLLGSVWRLLPTFANHKQHDASEFLSLFLDHLSEELSTCGVKSTLKTHIFSGLLSTTARCSRCRASRPFPEEPFFELGLDIPANRHVLAGRRAAGTAAGIAKFQGPTSLTDLLAAFCAEEPLEFKCSHCAKGEPVNGVRQQRIKRLPNVLVFQVKRFVWMQERRVGGKLATRISFPIAPDVLDMRPFLDTGASSADRFASEFTLRAVVVHEGGRLSSGHYFTYGWDQRSSVWVNYNDAKVTVTQKDKVASCEPYLLFYERVEEQKLAAPVQLRASVSFSIDTDQEAPSTICVIDRKDAKRARASEALPLPLAKRSKGSTSELGT